MAVYVYDKIKKKVVLERDRTDRKPKSAYIKIKFTGDGVKNKQLAPNLAAWNRNDPACYYKSYDDLERKAKAQGMVVNNWAADRSSMTESGPTESSDD